MDKKRGVWLAVLGLIQGPNKAARKKKKEKMSPNKA
jgi:hypothetical protein